MDELMQALMQVDVAGAIQTADHLGVSLEEVLDRYYGIKL